MSATPAQEEASVVAAYRDMYRGMLERDTDLLDSLLSDDYTLTHMTGYRQSRAVWLQQVADGEMAYHSSQERNTSVALHGDKAVLIGRNRVDATIWGSRGTWNLQLTTEYERRAGTWLAVRTVATTF